MSTAPSNLTSFAPTNPTSSAPTRRVWHIDVPLTYPAPPIGRQMTIALITPCALPPATDACPDLVIACARGIPVWMAEVTQAGAPASLPMALLGRHEAPWHVYAHLTAAQVRVIDWPIHAFSQPQLAGLAQAIADASDTSNEPTPGTRGAATLLDATIASAVSELLAPTAPTLSTSTASGSEVPSKTISMPRDGQHQSTSCQCAENHIEPYWAIEIPHNYSPAYPHCRLTVFVMTVGHHRAMRPGDLVFGFAQGKLELVARAIGSSTPPELKVSINVSADPRYPRGYITTAEVEVLELDLQSLYDDWDASNDGDTFMFDILRNEVSSLFPGPRDCSFGDARPCSDLLGRVIAHGLGLLHDDQVEDSTATSASIPMVCAG